MKHKLESNVELWHSITRYDRNSFTLYFKIKENGRFSKRLKAKLIPYTNRPARGPVDEFVLCKLHIYEKNNNYDKVWESRKIKFNYSKRVYQGETYYCHFTIESFGQMLDDSKYLIVIVGNPHQVQDPR